MRFETDVSLTHIGPKINEPPEM
ncbi:hypothetical protein DSM3645_18756 [Blastopirellula marina DSM 3645]|uniref:Uncharacterized protein n=1 Tax=Blastopirellula marina DSM 3645 TaxID=314230 RepID=A3ZZC7_9BACT|nr:hypothetical protein DSM3645_18756 [Blastopirellula marina DSM 3645]